jgi:hypothetical protein
MSGVTYEQQVMNVLMEITRILGRIETLQEQAFKAQGEAALENSLANCSHGSYTYSTNGNRICRRCGR